MQYAFESCSVLLYMLLQLKQTNVFPKSCLIDNASPWEDPCPNMLTTIEKCKHLLPTRCVNRRDIVDFATYTTRHSSSSNTTQL